jgi:glycosyltransferase involved in cell wall biosynthesis
MRIGLILYGLDRPLSGISRYSLELVLALDRLAPRHDVILLSAGEPGPLVGQVRFRQEPLAGCRLLPALVTLGSLSIPRRARQLGLDLVHDLTGVSPFGLGAGGSKMVATVHDVFAWSFPGTSTLADTFIYRYWLPRIISRVDAVITDSQVSRSDIEKYLMPGRHNISIIPLGVNPVYRQLPREQTLSIVRKHVLTSAYILFVGSVEKRKNLGRLLRAYAQLAERGEQRSLVVVGASRGRLANASGLRRILNDHDLEHKVIFTGYVPEADLPALYNGADLFVFPSLYEGFGLPPLEAMACGTPVVTSNASSLPEVVGDAAITVDPYDVDALTSAMRRVLADPCLRDELRQKGLARASEFTWERTARQTLAVYRQVLVS